MTDVSTSTLAGKVSALEYRVELIETERKKEFERKIERDRQRMDLFMRLVTYGMVLIAAVLLSVSLTLEATGK